jgi:hypothetical protein
MMNSPMGKPLLFCLVIGALVHSALATEEATKRPDYEIQPLFTYFARTPTKVTLRSTVATFDDVELQEANHFDGISVEAELAIPFLRRFQLILAGPIYTSGEAELIQPGHPSIDLWGWSGTFEFPNVQLQWQFLTEETSRMNMAVHAGYGTILGKLHTTTDDFFHVGASDIYNHGGNQIIGGLRMDRTINDWLTFAGNVGATYYLTSDDLHPDGGGDSWALGNFSAAAIVHPWEARVYPTLELVYSTDFGDYNSVMFVPQVIVPVCSNFEFKIGVTVGATGDGEDYGARFQGVRF